MFGMTLMEFTDKCPRAHLDLFSFQYNHSLSSTRTLNAMYMLITPKFVYLQHSLSELLGTYPACYSLNSNWLTKEHFKLRMCSTKLCISVSGSPGLKTWPHPRFFSFSHTSTSNPSENPLGQQFPAPDSLAVSKILSEVLGGQNYLHNNTKTFCLVHSYLYISAPWSFPLLHYDM